MADPFADPALRIAVLIPCFNEEHAIGQVVRDFRSVLPGAVIYVYDNNSRDRTRQIAAEAGAIVREETRQGKGFAVRRMFSDIEADAYVLVDGDGTYDPSKAAEMVTLLLANRLDMVVGRRVGDAAAYRRSHQFGNRLFTGVVARIFGKRFEDILSGYRVFSRRFVKSFTVSSGGFEIETEITIHALTLNLPIREIDTPYRTRLEGSHSKLNTYKDGMHILVAIFTLFREEQPLAFFSIVGSAFILAALILIYPVIVEFLRTGLVPRFPTAILSMGLVVSGLLSFAAGVILDTVTRGRRETKLLAYLAIPVCETALRLSAKD
ncbi:MAG TPA: glycosyltransferase [Bryobacteraceae bacterium]|jgi:glycosyltransferase involved in cell wall biosynthesis